MGSTHFRKVFVVSAGLMLVAPVSAIAQQDVRPVDFHIVGGSLDKALTQIASQSGRQLLFDPAIVRGRTVPGMDGRMMPEVAVRRLLEGSGLALRIDGNGQWLIVRGAQAVSVPQEKVLGTVRVTAGSDRLGYVGANGSSDPLATEGTKSYTTHAQAIATKQPLSLKDTPEAVSVVTRQQLDDRALNSFDNVLAALPGVSTVDTGSTTNIASIYSRGFELNNVQIDGGSPISIGSNQNFNSSRVIVDDLSIYDNVQLERGAAGQFTGVGSPGGVLSLVRKRPLDHAALDMTVQGGSWDRFRGVVDASSPAVLDGLVRARAVLTAERNDEFYDVATRRFWQAYLNVEVDPSPDMTINLGASFNYNRATPFNGLPTDKTGALMALPRSTCICAPWSKATTNGKEFFGQITQKLGKDWELHINASANLQNIDYHILNYAVVLGGGGGYDPDHPSYVHLNAYFAKRRSDQYLSDAYITGKMKIFSMGVDLTAGANFQSAEQAVTERERNYPYSGLLLPFSASNFPEPLDSQLVSQTITYPRSSQVQYGVYGTIRISPTSWAHITVGERYTHYRVDSVTNNNYAVGKVFVSNNKVDYSIFSPPNFGITFDVSKRVSLFGNYQNIFDRSNLIAKSGALVDPTTGFNAEAGVKATLFGGKLNASGSAFYIRQINVPQYDYNSAGADNQATGSSCCYFSDGSRYQSKGGEVQLQGALTRKLNVDLSYTYTDFEFVPGLDGESYPQPRTQPAHLVKLWGVWQPPVAANRLQVGVGVHAESSVHARYTVTGYTPGVGFTQVTYDTARGSYITANAMLKYTVSHSLDVQLNVENVFDATYYKTVNTMYGNYYGTPRSFLISLHGRL